MFSLSSVNVNGDGNKSPYSIKDSTLLFEDTLS
jgi:hypothetical protein